MGFSTAVNKKDDDNDTNEILRFASAVKRMIIIKRILMITDNHKKRSFFSVFSFFIHYHYKAGDV